MLNEIVEILGREWRDVLIQSGIELRPPLSILKIGNDELTRRKVNLLVFNHHEQQPILILRLTQIDEQSSFLEREYETLCKLAKHESLASSIPHPLGLLELQGTLIVVESVVPGVSIFLYLHRRKHIRPFLVKQDFELACDFLHELERVTMDGDLPFPDAGMVQDKLEQLCVNYGSTGIPKDYQEQLLKIADEYRSLRLVRCARHGDYWPGNFLVSSGRIGVIDWEGFTYPDDLFHDIFFFTSTYALFYPWHGWGSCSPEEAFSLGFIERNWLSARIKETLERFFLKLNIPPRAMCLLFILFLIEMAIPSAIKNDPRDPPQHEKWFSLLKIIAQSKNPFLAK